MRKFLVFFAFLGFLSTKAFASLPDFTHNTPSALEPAVTSQSYQVAGIYWLPDYLGKNMDTNGRVNDRDNGGDTDKNCSDYGFEACQAPKTLRPGASPVHPVQGLDCYKKSDCICPTGTGGYNYSSANCSGNKQPSGDTCNDLYKECTCKEGFTYNSTNCKGEYQLAGDSCDDNYQRCDPKPCSDGNYSDKTIDGKICSAVTYGGRTCQACRDKTCEEKCSGFQTGVTCTKGQNTETCSSECGSYVKCTGEACPSGVGNCKYGCQTYSTQKGCTDVCLECEKCAPSCTNETDCPYGTETVDNGCGGTCIKCKKCTETCANTVDTKPANSSYITKQCTACGKTTTINTGWECNSGFNKSNNSCVAANDECKQCLKGLNEAIIPIYTAEELKKYAAQGNAHLAIMNNIVDKSATLDLASGTNIYFISSNECLSKCAISTANASKITFQNITAEGTMFNGYGELTATEKTELNGFLIGEGIYLRTNSLYFNTSAILMPQSVEATKVVIDGLTSMLSFTSILNFKTLEMLPSSELTIMNSSGAEEFNIGSGDSSVRGDGIHDFNQFDVIMYEDSSLSIVGDAMVGRTWVYNWKDPAPHSISIQSGEVTFEYLELGAPLEMQLTYADVTFPNGLYYIGGGHTFTLHGSKIITNKGLFCSSITDYGDFSHAPIDSTIYLNQGSSMVVNGSTISSSNQGIRLTDVHYLDRQQCVIINTDNLCQSPNFCLTVNEMQNWVYNNVK